MASISHADFTRALGSHNYEVANLMNSRALAVYPVTLTFSATDEYAAGGITVDLKHRVRKVIHAFFNTADIGFGMKYNDSTNKVQMYKSTGAEITATDNARFRGKTVSVLVFGEF